MPEDKKLPPSKSPSGPSKQPLKPVTNTPNNISGGPQKSSSEPSQKQSTPSSESSKKGSPQKLSESKGKVSANSLLKPADQKLLEIKFVEAAEERNLKKVASCLNKGVNPNVLINDWTALHIAAERGDTYLMLKLTTCKNLNLNLQTSFGNTPLLIACRRQVSPKFIKTLLKFGANPNIYNKTGSTPLLECAMNNSITAAMFLLKAKAKVNVADCFGETPLSIAVINTNFLPMVKLLINYGGDPNFIVPMTMPLLLRACLSCSVHSKAIEEVITYLTTTNINLQITDPITQKNALHIVAGTNNTELATLLMRKRVDIFKRDAAGRTPLQIAKIYENHEMVMLIEDYLLYLEYFNLRRFS